MIALLISAGIIGASIIINRPNLRWSIPRIMAVIVLYGIINNWSVRIPKKAAHALPALLIDCSASMQKHLPRIITGLDEIAFPCQTFFFSESLVQITTPDDKRAAISMPGQYTNIAEALTRVRESNPPAILLVSDGLHNFGEPPLSGIDRFGIPIYTFGSPRSEVKDLSITDVYCPAYIFTGDSIRIKVIVESQGFPGGEAKVLLRSRPKGIRQSRSFPLSGAWARNEVEFLCNAPTPGRMEIDLSLVDQDGAVIPAEGRECSVDILDRRIRVLYYTDHPSFTSRFMVRAVEDDPQCEMVKRIKMAKDEVDVAVPDLTGIDVVILDNVDLRDLPWSPDELLSRSRGILFSGSVQDMDALWQAVLPITVGGGYLTGDFKPKIVQAFAGFDLDEDYPPLHLINRVNGVKDGAVVIVQADGRPIIAYRHYQSSVVFQINGLDLGEWFFAHAGIKQENPLGRFVGDVIRFINPGTKQGRLVLSVSQRTCSVGETIRLVLQSYDRNFRRCGGGDFYGDYGMGKVPFFEITPGQYEATMTADEVGGIWITAYGQLNNENLESNRLGIKIIPGNREREGLDQQLLMTLAARTGGEYHSLEEFARFQLPQKDKIRTGTVLGFNTPPAYFLIFILCGLDWLMRRRRGSI